MSSNAREAPKPGSTMDAILERMQLTHPGDRALLMKLVPWIEAQRPKFMYTSVLSIAVLLQRLARAFSMRSSSTGSKPGSASANRPRGPTILSATTALTASPGHSVVAAPPFIHRAAKEPATQQQRTPKRKAFRSAKKLDLSPKVVASLKGFVIDLASTIPLILEHVQYQQWQQPQETNMGGLLLTAVDIIEVCLHMIEGEVATSQPSASSKGLPNAAMELYRKILGRAISNKSTFQEKMASTMDQLKFKTFCAKTLESAQSQAISAVESLHDFRLLWTISREQHSVEFVPVDATSHQKEELAWKLAFSITWKRQEEHPDLCTRRERILAAATSMIILCIFPLLHRHNKSEADKALATLNPKSNINNKCPVEGGDDISSITTKLRRVGSTENVPSETTSVASEGKAERLSYGSCGRCISQERTLGVVIHACRNATSFLRWAHPNPVGVGRDAHQLTDAGTEIERNELDEELLKVTRQLAVFSKFARSLSSHWMECIKSAVGMKDTDDSLTMGDAEKNLVALLEDSFNAIQLDEDERLGTRVEAVPYIEELYLMNAMCKGYTRYLCKTTYDRLRERNELVACVPQTSRLGCEINNSKLRESADSANIFEYQAKPIHPRVLMVDDSLNDFLTPNRGIPSPATTEPLELNEWTTAALSLSLKRIQPSPKLRALLDQDPNAVEVDGTPTKSLSILTNVIIPLLIQFLGFVQQAAGCRATGTIALTIGEEGEVRAHRTQDAQFNAAIVQLYYHALESILVLEKGAAGSTAVKSGSFHEALMACSYLCVVRAVTITGKMQLLMQPENHQVYSMLPVLGSTPYTYLKVSASFLRALTSTITGNATPKQQLLDTYGTLPRILKREVLNSEMHVIESLLWVRDKSRSMVEGSIVNAIADLKQTSHWPPECLEPKLPREVDDGVGSTNKEGPQPIHPEFAFVSYVMRKLLRVAYFRIQSICKALCIPSCYPVASQVWLAFRFLLRNQVELLYGRHVDQWILCTIYGICKVMKFEPDVTFVKAINAYTSLRGSELGVSTCEAIVRHVKILDAVDNESDHCYVSTKMGNIINLYNLVFVPVMKTYLLHSKAIARDTVTPKRESVDERMKKSLAFVISNTSPQSKDTRYSKLVREGNAAIHITACFGGPPARPGTDSRNCFGTSIAAVMLDHEECDPRFQYIPGTSDWEPPFATFLQFGRVSAAKVSFLKHPANG